MLRWGWGGREGAESEKDESEMKRKEKIDQTNRRERMGRVNEKKTMKRENEKGSVK